MDASFTHSYVTELERLILDELLPVYDKYHAEKGIKPDYKSVHPDLLKEIKRKKIVPALLRDYEKRIWFVQQIVV